MIKLSLSSPKKDQCDVYMSYKVWKVQDSNNQDALECHLTDNTVLKTCRMFYFHLVYTVYDAKNKLWVLFWSKCATDSFFNMYMII